MLNQRSFDTIYHILGELDTEGEFFFSVTLIQSIDKTLSRTL